MRKKIITLILCPLFLLVACSNKTPSVSAPVSIPQGCSDVPFPQQQAKNETAETINALLLQLQDTATAHPLSTEFFEWGNQNIEPKFTQTLLLALQTQPYSDDIFYTLFGKSLHVLYDEFTAMPQAMQNQHTIMGKSGSITLAFTGDINFSDTWETMRVLNVEPDGLAGCLSPPLLERLQAADILLVNNEFPYSLRGKKMPGKQYTFRANPDHVSLLQQMGVDIVSLGNNHVFDYGEDAFYDTLATLQGANIPYIGAGENLAEAMRPQYFTVGGLKIGYVAASRAEKYILTPEATETAPGVLRAYDPTLFLQAVQTAKKEADIVIAYPHWGTENTAKLEEAQTQLGHRLIDAGADFVIGAHPHCLQGLEYYNGKPIVYSLGNFWFNTATVDTALLEVTLSSPTEFSVQILPCQQRGGKTSLLGQAEGQPILQYLQSLSPGVSIDMNGLVTQG